jgi:N-sulfoglucosamine sulfohydrolase
MQRLLSLTLAATLAAGVATAAPKNVVLVVTDDQGQDAGCYGNPVLKTPHLDRLAAEGTRFRLAFASTASCSPSRSVILNGKHNHATGQYGLAHANHHFVGFDKLQTLPALLRQAGYRTALAGKFHVLPEPLYPFDVTVKGNPRNSVRMAEGCQEFIKESGDRPFFLYFCPTDPHRGGGKAGDLPEKPDLFGNADYPGVTPATYSPKDVIVPPFLPDTPACRAELAQYYQSVSRADQGLGRLVQVLKDTGKYDDTLIIFVSDNGIPFPGAKTTHYEPGLKLPCVVRAPGASRRGVVSDAMVSWVDLTPTILDYAGALPKNPRAFHGRSVLPVVSEPSPAGWDEVYASHTFHEVTMYYPMRTVRERRYKLIWNIASPLSFPFASDLWGSATWQDAVKRGPDFVYGKRTVAAYKQRPAYELYDLEADPNETVNLADKPEHAATKERLVVKVKAFQVRTGDPWAVKWEHE